MGFSCSSGSDKLAQALFRCVCMNRYKEVAGRKAIKQLRATFMATVFVGAQTNSRVDRLKLYLRQA